MLMGVVFDEGLFQTKLSPDLISWANPVSSGFGFSDPSTTVIC